jgi:Galactose oxidase, central domain/Kelch motif
MKLTPSAKQTGAVGGLRAEKRPGQLGGAVSAPHDGKNTHMGKLRKIARFISILILTKALVLSSIAAPMLSPIALAPPATDPGWVFTGSLNTRRNSHTATLLPNGKVLVAGGTSGASEGTLNSAELYDPATGTWSRTGSLNVPRFQSTATLLPNGKVLVAGGISNPTSVTATAELYDPATGTWSLTGDLNSTRFWHSATLLSNGKVLIAGGHGGQDGPRGSAELYDPASETWTITGSLFNTGRAGRMMHTATLLQNGKVLVVGGIDGDDFEVGFSSAELYDIDTGTWSAADSLRTNRALHTATLLQNGLVLVVGGSNFWDSAEQYDPVTNTWSHGGTLIRSNRSSHTATLLPAGRVLIAGGYADNLQSLNSAELYKLGTGTWSTTASLQTARSSHTATPLQNGKVLIAGGFDSASASLNSAELYDPSTTSTNPIDDPQFFVRQHYIDFLLREPDPSGLAFWTNEVTSCVGDSQCVETKRINVSAAFFLSIEFQETGYLVYRIYKAAYGETSSPNVIIPVPIIRLHEFLTDAQRMGQGVQVGIDDWREQLEANKNSYAREFVTRQRFLTAYPLTMSAVQFVDELNRNAGDVLSSAERDDLIVELNAATDVTVRRATVLLRLAENGELRQREKNRAFVLMQYFGYLRRNPDGPPDSDFRGWEFWLNKLNEFNGNFIDAEMVKAFLVSSEYRKRFGPL